MSLRNKDWLVGGEPLHARTVIISRCEVRLVIRR